MLEGVKQIGHVGLAVRDLDRSVAFYCDTLGLSLTERFEYPEDEVGHGVTVRAGAFLRCNSTHHCLSIFVLKDSALDPGGTPVYGLHHIAFEVSTPEQLLALYRDFKARGIEIVNAREGGPGNQPRFYAQDPDGNLLEFYWGIDEIGWDGRAREYPPITEIELEDFDFEQFVETRRLAALAADRVR
ncbi:MAG: VOC family protein [Actinobacteria bacterium]|nr:VOC family protein [Actinomycetota bacterium]